MRREPLACGTVRGTGQAFSLVELLVVIGIIAILLSLLMPAMTSARVRSRELACQNTLRNIGMAAQLHAHDHDGYMPAAGFHWDLPGGVLNPKGLGDDSARRYTYFMDDGIRRPVPVTAALAIQLGQNVRLDSRGNLEADLQEYAVRRHFKCPSQEREQAAITQRGGNWDAPREWSSYIFNEAFLGKREAKAHPDPPMGKVTKVARPSEVMLAMDGRPRDPLRHYYFLVPDNGPEWTLLDFQRAAMDPNDTILGKEGMDFLRHRWRMNVLFIDGHVTSVPMTDSGLASVGLSRGFH